MAISIGTKDTSVVGDIRQSILTEAQFQSLMGTGWILADGRNIVGSKLHATTGQITSPDARGMVLRGKNNGRSDGRQNPEGDLALGSFQNDQMQGHWHQLHSGQYKYGLSGNANYGYDAALGNFTANNLGDLSRAMVTDGTNGTPRVGNETRMRNITVNTFIKIN